MREGELIGNERNAPSLARQAAVPDKHPFGSLRIGLTEFVPTVIAALIEIAGTMHSLPCRLSICKLLLRNVIARPSFVSGNEYS